MGGLASLAFIEARLDRYGGGEALSVCPLSLALSVITNLMRLRNRRANSNMKLNTGAGCATHFQGIQIASSHTNINRQPTASLAPVTTRRPRKIGISGTTPERGALNDRRIGPRSDSRPDGRRLARSLPYTSLLYNVETETMMSTEIETRVRGGIVIPSVCGGVE